MVRSLTTAKIAITAYVDNKPKFVDEANLMTYSGRGLDGRFTFVLYAHPDIVDQLDRHMNVRIIPYTVPDKQFYKDYGFAKSMVFPYDMPEPLLEYDYVCKTDTDVFLTPIMNNFPFETNKIYVGLGSYSISPGSVGALQDAAIKFGYPEYKRIADMHSTIIGPTKDIIDIMRLSDELEETMYYGLEEDGAWGSDILWRGPIGLNSGVCSMYAMEIVLSSVYNRKNIIVTDLLDATSESYRPWTEVYHMHQYHHDFIYSKFQAKWGSYLDAEYTNGRTCADYSLNTYISKINYMKNKSELFVNHNIYVETPPPDPWWPQGSVFKYRYE
jgi:hypothetical protein